MVQVKILDDADPIKEIDNRLDALEKYGIYKTLSDLKGATAQTDKPYTLLTNNGRVEYTYVLGDYTGQDDDISVVKMLNISLSQGALVRQSGTSISFKREGSAAVIRDFTKKMQEQASVKDFRGNDRVAFQAAADSGAKDILIPKGDYGLDAAVVITGEGVGFRGQADMSGTTLTALGSQDLFVVGSGTGIVQHVSLSNFTIRADASFTGKSLIRINRAFQVYLERMRYKQSFKAPTEAIVVLDNNAGTSEQPVRTTFRDWYVDGADYNPTVTGPPVPVAFWNTGGIQTIFENTHIQDCVRGWKLGVNPAVDTQYYNPSLPNEGDFYDLYITNNCRYQVGDRGGVGNTARGIDIWRGSGVHVSQTQFYLNNNGPDPALTGQRAVVFNSPDFGMFSMEQSLFNGNARTDHAFQFAVNATCRRLAVSSSEFNGLMPGKFIIAPLPSGASVRAVLDGTNLFDNPNSFGPVDQRANTSISTYNIGTGNSHYFVNSDNTNRTISSFANGSVGTTYVHQFEITSGSVTLVAVGPTATSGIVVDGFAAGPIVLQNGDMLISVRVPLMGGEFYRAKLIRSSGLPMTYAQMKDTVNYPPDAIEGAIIYRNGKWEGLTSSGWKQLAFVP